MKEDFIRSETRPRLGRGLAVLLGEAKEEPQIASERVRKLPLEFLKPNLHNPRRRFDDAELSDLAASINKHGVIQPILARAIAGTTDAFEIVAGERRWRAAQQAGLNEIPVLVLDAGDREAFEIGIIENIQRSDLNPLEEAAGYARLAAEHGYSPADIALVVGKSRSHIANTLRLTNLPPRVRSLVESGKISAGHARALLAVPDADSIADQIIAEGLTVRDVERLGQKAGQSRRRVDRKEPLDPDTRALQERISLALGTKVTIRRNGQVGEVRVLFSNLEQLEELGRRLCLE